MVTIQSLVYQLVGDKTISDIKQEMQSYIRQSVSLMKYSTDELARLMHLGDEILYIIDRIAYENNIPATYLVQNIHRLSSQNVLLTDGKVWCTSYRGFEKVIDKDYEQSVFVCIADIYDDRNEYERVYSWWKYVAYCIKQCRLRQSDVSSHAQDMSYIHAKEVRLLLHDVSKEAIQSIMEYIGKIHHGWFIIGMEGVLDIYHCKPHKITDDDIYIITNKVKKYNTPMRLYMMPESTSTMYHIVYTKHMYHFLSNNAIAIKGPGMTKYVQSGHKLHSDYELLRKIKLYIDQCIADQIINNVECAEFVYDGEQVYYMTSYKRQSAYMV